MSMLLTTLLSSLVPVGAETIKQVIATKLGGIKPVTIDDQIRLDDQEIKRANALAALDNPGGTPSQWVVDLRASSRYLASWACIGIGSYLLTDSALAAAGTELISVAFGFLFGTRLVAGWAKR